MADVTGPISTLPGSGHSVPEGQTCDFHPDRPAVARIQGETDSMGSEMNDCCQECSDTIKAHAKEARTGVCDWCKLQVSDLRPARDYDEGMSGRVYDVCGRCVRKQTEEATQWLREYDDEVDN